MAKHVPWVFKSPDVQNFNPDRRIGPRFEAGSVPRIWPAASRDYEYRQPLKACQHPLGGLIWLHGIHIKRQTSLSSRNPLYPKMDAFSNEMHIRLLTRLYKMKSHVGLI